MVNILDRVAASHPVQKFGAFVPQDPKDYLALRLACRLGEPGAARHYAEIVKYQSEERALCAFRRALSEGKQHLASRFHTELKRLAGRPAPHEPARKLASIRIERRAVALVILSGDHMEYPPMVRQLPSDGSKALGSAAMFITHVLEQCPVQMAALETIPEKRQGQRLQLAAVIKDVLRKADAGICEISKHDVLASFALPPLRFRKQVRKVIAAMWPDANGRFGGPLIQDALATALYCHAEQVLTVND